MTDPALTNETYSFLLNPGNSWILTIGIVAYLFIMLFIGWFTSRKIKCLADFLVAGRRLPFWMATATLLATWFGAGSSMGVAATVFSDGLSAVIADPFAASISLVLAGFFIVKKLREKNYFTVTDIVEQKYGKKAGIYTSFWLLPVYIGWLGAQILGFGTLVHILFGTSVFWGSIIGAIIVVAYTLCGGMWAVTLTDVVQVSIIILGLVSLIPGVFTEVGSFQNPMDSIPAKDVSLSMASATGGGTAFNDYIYYIGGWIIMGLGCMVGQDLMQRSLSSKTPGIARTSSITSGIMYMLIGIVPILIGFAARIILPKYGITPETMGTDLENQVLPRVALVIFGKEHMIILILFLGALMSAILSSADSSLLAGSSLFANNVLKPLKNLPEKHMLAVTRIVTLIFAVLALVLALGVNSIYQLMINCWASQLVIVFIPVMAAIYLPKSTKRSAWACLASSTAVWLGYVVVCCTGLDLGFMEIMESTELTTILTCGAVYGFAAGIICFAVSYIFFDLKESKGKGTPAAA